MLIILCIRRNNQAAPLRQVPRFVSRDLINCVTVLSHVGKGFGTFTDFTIKDSPAHAISVGTSGGSAVFSNVLVDNRDGASLGKNTDGFDVSADDVTIKNSTVFNQDDCLAFNSVRATIYRLCSSFIDVGYGTGLQPRL